MSDTLYQAWIRQNTMPRGKNSKSTMPKRIPVSSKNLTNLQTDLYDKDSLRFSIELTPLQAACLFIELVKSGLLHNEESIKYLKMAVKEEKEEKNVL